MIILGIETSCDEVGIALYDDQEDCIRAHTLFSQLDLFALYGGVVPEIASRSHLEHIDSVLYDVLKKASLTMAQIDVIAVVHKPGLIGSLLVGMCFAKSLAWIHGKKLIGVDHLEAHIYSAFLGEDMKKRTDITFPHINLSVSGGHTALYLVHDFGIYELLGTTLDDAAGEAFDKVSKMLGFGYPGGPVIEKLAQEVGFQDFCSFPRTKNLHKDFTFTFSGIKTAVLYELARRNVYDLAHGYTKETITRKIQQEIASSLLVCVGDIFEAKMRRAMDVYPDIKGYTFVGGVACNEYLKKRLSTVFKSYGKEFVSPPKQFCVDNGAMVAFVGAYKAQRGEYATFDLDVSRNSLGY